MASHLEIELDKLRSIIIKIGSLAEGQVSEAVKALLLEPGSEIKEVKKTETKIDKLDVKIEDICLGIFALQQPVASDLRFIMSATQISSQIERIGDLSMSIMKLTKNIKEKHELMYKFNIASLGKDIEEIVSKTNECVKNMDESIITGIFALNSLIKSKSGEAIENIIDEMKSNPKKVVSGTHMIIALKHFERIADHCSNIAESIYFVINAKIVRHEKFNL